MPVRRALAALGLGPGVRTGVEQDGGRVGVVLLVEVTEGNHVGPQDGPQDGPLGRVVPGTAAALTGNRWHGRPDPVARGMAPAPRA
ncbi:hypothetical protein AB0C68_04030 [Streptomyces tendae]|uniref:hypothetical protein n=1 Tax=Streptomyces tendae TaxID=1932 RepID=UPI0033CBA896